MLYSSQPDADVVRVGTFGTHRYIIVVDLELAAR